MNRRQILRQLGVVTGGVILFPGCDFSKEDVLAAYENLKIKEEDKNMLSHLCRVILPDGDDEKGADALEAEDFVLVMVNDCFDPESGERFLSGMKKFKEYVSAATGKELDKLSTESSEQLILDILEGGDQNAGSEDQDGRTQIRYFLQTTKDLTIRGFMTSEYVMTQKMPYKLVPGKFVGKLKIDQNEKVNIYD